MDKLFARQGKIQKQLARKHLSDGCLVFYDISSSYLEGECAWSEIAAISFVCAKGGMPGLLGPAS